MVIVNNIFIIVNREKNMNKQESLDFFKTFPFWEQMTSGEQELLLSNTRELHYEAGKAIQTGECHCLGTLFLLKGCLLYTSINPILL